MEYLNLYEDFLLKNASQITSIETSLRSLTYILPGRFHDAELASQALYATLNLIGLYHNSILRRAVQENTNMEESAFNKYIRFWSSRSKLNSTASVLLSIMTYTQVLMEMAVLKKLDKKRQWQLIVLIESLKVLLRLVVFQTTGQRMTLYPNHLQRDVDPSTLVTQDDNNKDEWIGKRTGIKIPSLKSEMDVTEYLLSKVLTPEKLCKPEQMVQVQKNISKLGELLYIIRPLIYVISILRWGKKSWKPWVLSILIELVSLLSLKKGYKVNKGSYNNNMMPLEKQEYHRRLKLILLNLMRGAFYVKMTRPRLERFCNKAESKPILSIIAGKKKIKIK
ncbi:peroxisome membrane protein [Cokeromyces recurvatus]|uniref:peroxisome membrane protein n=1 Tax=Cokeromyces recurvatus TaxID=90255 RepID=UPI00221E94DA|nr:peroxisome membrane protein [Cokeromyces recurvatus]KAI7898403.1 peroxisome membrane protein [Cokeromyces recurvatus]